MQPDQNRVLIDRVRIDKIEWKMFGSSAVLSLLKIVESVRETYRLAVVFSVTDCKDFLKQKNRVKEFC